MARCKCDFGYGGERCQVYAAVITAAGAVGFMLVVMIVFLLVRRYRRRYKRLHHEMEEQQQLIVDHRERLNNLERVWEVQAEDVQLLRPLGAGAFGEVWLATWWGRQIAVKKVRVAMRELDPDADRAFQAEVETCRTMRHRNVVLFFGAGIMDGAPFLVTEFMERGSLRDILDAEGDALPWARRWRFALDIASGMRYLHSLTPPRLHRELKCANVLVSGDFVCKLADFGTARLLRELEQKAVQQRAKFAARRAPALAASAEPDLTGPISAGWQQAVVDYYQDYKLTTAVGTLLWTAPEVHARRAYGLPADVYSFGIVLAELAAPTRLPFAEHAETLALRNMIAEDHIRPRLPRETPARWVELAYSCWTPDPRSRMTFPQICEDLQAELGRQLDD